MTLQVRSNPGKPISIMFGATQMPFYGKNNNYSSQTMYFRLQSSSVKLARECNMAVIIDSSILICTTGQYLSSQGPV